MNNQLNKFIRSVKLIALVSVAVGVVSGFTSCSSGSGSDNNENINTGGGGDAGFTYNGPAPSTEDIQSFQSNVWRPLVESNRCGGCHTQRGPGTGAFVHDENVNLAYQAALPLVDLTAPANSRLVERVANGHNCWLTDDSACAQIIENYITAWAADTGSVVNVISLVDRPYYSPGNARNFPASSDGFRDNIWTTLLRQGGGATNPLSYCSQCHSEDSANQQQPWFAHANVDTAYSNARALINLDTPAASRFVTKLQSGHNCWTPSDCAGNAETMRQAIAAFAGTITPTQVPSDWNITGAANLEDDGIEAATGGRVQNNVIASYTFMAPQAASASNNSQVGTVFDVSGVNPAADLRNVNGAAITWSGSRGVRINAGRLQTTLGSEKFRDLIELTGEYSIEAWVAPDNVVQDDSARIVTYSQSENSTNFVLGQTLYNYDFYNRSSVTDTATGGPAYSTPDADEVLQATLQHVVVTFDPINGRKIYVNGRDANDTPDPTIVPGTGAIISNWASGMVMGVGAEPGNNRQWQGVMRLLAIHNRALSEEDISNNFGVGVGAKFFMMFNLSDAGLVDAPRAYIVFEVEVYDGASYLFTNPFFISLDTDWTPTAPIVIEGMRIGINAKESELGQAYAKLSTTINSTDYTPTGQLLSRIGTLIPIELGPQSRSSSTPGDVFFLTFERIGIAEDYVRPVVAAPTSPPSVDQIADLDPVSDIGIRHFHKINEALSAATGVTKGDVDVLDTYSGVKRSLPANQAIDEFQPSNQMSIVQVGAEYCLQLVNDDPGFFNNGVGGTFSFAAPANTAFNGDLIDDVIDPLLESLAAHNIAGNAGTTLTTQGNEAVTKAILTDQINDMVSECGGACNSTNTSSIVMATCTSVMSSAVMLLQ